MSYQPPPPSLPKLPIFLTDDKMRDTLWTCESPEQMLRIIEGFSLYILFPNSELTSKICMWKLKTCWIFALPQYYFINKIKTWLLGDSVALYFFCSSVIMVVEGTLRDPYPCWRFPSLSKQTEGRRGNATIEMGKLREATQGQAGTWFSSPSLTDFCSFL